MISFIEDLYRRYTVQKDNEPLLAMVDLLSSFPSEFKDGKLLVTEDPVRDFLKQYHLTFGNKAAYLLAMLGQRLKHVLTDASSSLWQDFLFLVFTAYKHDGQPGLLLLNNNISLDLNLVTGLAYPFRHRILKTVFGRTEAEFEDNEEIDTGELFDRNESCDNKVRNNIAEDAHVRKTPAAIPSRLNELAKKKAELQQKHQEKMRAIDERMAKLRKKQSETRINSLKPIGFRPVNLSHTKLKP